MEGANFLFARDTGVIRTEATCATQRLPVNLNSLTAVYGVMSGLATRSG